eukprot:CAMPEP_0113496906 /NCGR_PEP_ID=MMETSP0014_2-20120614/30359_1 /TAXON_ID=2857 /ORGANISM="Nitzschia sp." /LENGTH=507 /DNA_ID=CAMNT_0000390835 /DNA_START=126 /DNA_END=1646 /DNA_ORIENTATION=+ /assembly_acc=CAM_ASM_000159
MATATSSTMSPRRPAADQHGGADATLPVVCDHNDNDDGTSSRTTHDEITSSSSSSDEDDTKDDDDDVAPTTKKTGGRETMEPTPSQSNTTAAKSCTTTTTKTKSTSRQATTKSVRSLKDRSRIPLSFYVANTCLILSHYIIGFYSFDTLTNWKESMVHAYQGAFDGMAYLCTVMDDVWHGRVTDWSEVLYALVISCLVASVTMLLIGAPLRAGFWTGSRTKKHFVHRYMGLAFLIQYAAAWVEYLTNYDHAKDSVLLHFIALNGLIQGYSAYFSFKVLPDLEDPGYFSDKAVISRTFVHENTYFSLITAWGSIYYNELWLEKIQAHPLGRILEVIFVFFAYVAIRPFFPTTHVGSAGTGKGSRTEQNKSFYKYGTLAYKIFYLWAKYFLGFFINFLWLRRLCTPDEVKFIKGMYTLNLGTLSIGIFLHTLRFKGVLPGKLTFSIYLLQIYATFSAIPLAFNLFASHKMLCGAMVVGILANMTRKKWVHAAWCGAMLYLVKFRDDIDW